MQAVKICKTWEQQLVQADVVKFCRAVFETACFASGDRLVVDGVRHI